MLRDPLFHLARGMRTRGRGVWAGVYRRLVWMVIVAWVLSFLPWTPPALTPILERALQNQPEALRGATALALSVTGWADQALAHLGPQTVYAGTNVTLTLSKTDAGVLQPWLPAGPDPVQPGAELIYYIYITNTGTTTATVQLTETLPLGLECSNAGEVVGYEGGANWYEMSCGGQDVTLYTLDAFSPFFRGLGPGRSAVLYVQAHVSESVSDGHVFTNTQASYVATAAQEPAFIYTGANVVTTTVQAPRLSIFKTAAPPAVEAGQEVTFTLTISNSGHYTLAAPFTLTVWDRFPGNAGYVRHTLFPGTSQVDLETQAITWTIPFAGGELAPGEALAAELVLQAGVPLIHGASLLNADYGVSITPATLVTPAEVLGPAVDVQVSSRPDLSVAKGDAPDPVYADQDWTYWITVTNAPTAPGDAVGLVITDRVPLSTTLQSVSYALPGTAVSTDGSGAGSLITWTLPATYSLLWGESTSVSFTVHSASSTVVSPTVITNTDYGVNAANALAAVLGSAVTTTLWSQPVLQSAKIAAPSVITAANDTSDLITFTVAVTNLDTATADVYGVVITDTVPDHTELVSAGFSSGAGTVEAPSIAPGSLITWRLAGPLAPGESAVVSLTVHVLTPIDGGTIIENRGFAAGDGASTETNPVFVTVVSAPRLHILKSAEPTPTVGIGGLLTYTLVYSNDGHMVATGVVVTDILDANVVLDSAGPAPDSIAGQMLRWLLPPLLPGVQGQISVVVRVLDTVADNTTLINVAEVGCEQGQVAHSGGVTTIVHAPDIAVSKFVSPSVARPGDWVTYTLVFSNQGGAAAAQVLITDVLPVSLTLVTSTTVDAIFAGQVGTSYSWGAMDLAPGESGTITLTARLTTTGGWIVPAGTALVNTALVAAAGDTAPGNDTASASLTALPGPAAAIEAQIAPTTLPVPGPAVLSLIVTDLYGNRVADGDAYTVTCAGLPAGLGFSPAEVSIVDGAGTSAVTTTMAGSYVVRATVGRDPTIWTTAAVTFTAAVVDRLVVSPVSNQTAGISFTLAITALDQYGNVATGFNGTVPLVDTAAPNTLQPPVTQPFVNGVLSGQWVTITLARSNLPLRAGSGATQTDSNPFTVVSGAPATADLSAVPTIIPVGQDATATATIRDAYGNLIASHVLTFGLSMGTLQPVTATTNALGQASTSISSTLLGPATVVVTASSTVTRSIPVTFVAGYPATVLVTITPSSLAVGSTAVVTVEVQDAFGNPVDWDTARLSTADPLGMGSINPSFPADLDGSGRLVGSIDSTLPGLKQVVATATSNGVTGTAAVTFVVGPPESVVLVMDPNPQAVGTDATLRATVRDEYGNLVAGQVVTFSVYPGILGGGGIVPQTGTTDAGGVATTAISSTVATSTVATATLAANPAQSGTTVISFVAGAPAAITLTVQPDTVDGGVNATLRMTVTDAFGNPCPGRPVTLASDPLGGGGIVPNPAVTGGGGVATASISGTLPGPVNITATAAPGVMDTTVLTIRSGVLDHLELSPVPDPLIAGVSFTLIITAVDAAGNPRLDSGLVTIADATGTVAPGVANLVNGQATVVLSVTAAGPANQILVTWGGSPAVTGVSNLFTVLPAAPAALSLSASPSIIGINGVTSTLLVTVRDTYGNPIPGQAVTVTQVGGPAVVLTPTTGTTGAGGQLVVVLTSGAERGTAAIEAQCAGLAAQVNVQISQGLIFLPIVMRNYISVDLRPVGTIELVPRETAGYDIRVTVENTGTTTLTADFWVDLYIDPTGPVGLNVLWHDVSEYGKAWFVRQDLAPGQRLVLSTSDPDDPAFPENRYSNWPGNFETPGTHTLWVMVDSYGLANVGAAYEINEGNNILGPVIHTVSMSAVPNAGPLEPIAPRPTPAP